MTKKSKPAFPYWSNITLLTTLMLFISFLYEYKINIHGLPNINQWLLIIVRSCGGGVLFGTIFSYAVHVLLISRVICVLYGIWIAIGIIGISSLSNPLPKELIIISGNSILSKVIVVVIGSLISLLGVAVLGVIRWVAHDGEKEQPQNQAVVRRLQDKIEQPTRTEDSIAVVLWLFWRFCLYIPFFAQLHMMIKCGAISHISFLIRALLFLPYYIFIEISIRFIKRHEIVLAKKLSKSLGVSGILAAFLGIAFGVALNNLIIKKSGVNIQLLTVYKFMWAPLGIHLQYVLKTLLLRRVK